MLNLHEQCIFDAIKTGNVMGNRLRVVDYVQAEKRAAKRAARIASSSEEITLRFLHALREALERGEYYLKDSSGYAREKPRDGMLGIFTDATISIKAGEACKLYATAIGSTDPLNVVGMQLWPAMTAAGLGCRQGNAKWGGHYYAVRRIDREAVARIMPDWKLGKGKGNGVRPQGKGS